MVDIRRSTIALVITGDPAAYQALEVARLLVDAGARVIPVMTPDAEPWLGASALSELTGERVVREADGADADALARLADVVLLAPSNEDLLGRIAEGGADDLVTALAQRARGPVLVAPSAPLEDPVVRRAVTRLEEQGRLSTIGPAGGAPGDRRMADASKIVGVVRWRASLLDLASLRVIVTAGPTVEDIDPVRFIGNRSTGKMGFAVAERAFARGARVTLIAGRVSLPTPRGALRVDVRGALSMRRALWEALGADLAGADALVMTAAVADYRPLETHAQKRKRTEEKLTLELVPNPDLLAEIGAARTGAHPVLVGFAVETDTDERVVAYARGKLTKKRVDMVVANHASDAFGKDDNRATLVTEGGAEPLGVLPKPELADRILDRVARLCQR